MLRILESNDIAGLFARRGARLHEAEETVRPILAAVRDRGDEGVLEYARKFDGFSGESLRVPEAELAAAMARLPFSFRRAARKAAENVRRYAHRQMPKPFNLEKIGQIVRPIDTVGAYIPAGRYPLPSTVIMTVVPALVAGVRNICIATPRPVDEVCGVAKMLGVHNVFQMGGAQAIAAFAYGTKTVPKADRIVGPGNIYVAAAKKLIAGETGIDFVAGPTEILIIARSANASFIAADMLAQAEHDVDAASILLTTSKRLAAQVVNEVEAQIATLPTAPVARQAIDNNSAIVLVKDMEEAAEISNEFAPEHLSIPDESLLPLIRHAGSIFIGEYSPEAAGDYASGPNHVLPTSGASRLRGGLSVHDFVKIISIQRLGQSELRHLSRTITTLARSEGLEAHARSVEVRLG